jgi:hypothetical protein
MIKRRTFLQGLFALPALTFLHPPAAQAQAQTGLAYTDSIGTSNLSALHDGNLTTGIEYNA